ncbi:MAG TPA: c-type cytochrome biogenesis protein CcmI [Burkholderiales bacterium]|nr:c-type cytochrome biogenesis protein CcmI [Burkholderiales bacterium]
MIAFALIATGMAAVAVAWILVPLLRSRGAGGVDRDASNVAILRDQLADLQADLARGAIGPVQFEQARRELERRVLDEVSAAPDAATVQRGTPWAAAVLAGLVPVVAVLLYLFIGTPDALGPQARAGGAEGGHEVTREQVEKMVADLAARLEREPDNVNGWVVLARSYYVMNRFDDAARAYERAVTLVPNDPDLLADYADTLAVTTGGNLSGKPLELARRALAADPTHWKALALVGTEAFNRKDYESAIQYWEKLKATAPPGSPIAQSIDASIAEARELGGMKVAAKPPAQAAAAPAGGRVAGKVDLSPGLKGKVAPTDTVFVFARAAEGPRMPLAILRRQVKDLPFEFALDDSMAMAPNMKLSSFPDVVVGARVSRSGNATPQSGDLEGLSKPVKVGASGIAVVIDSALP